MGCVVDEIMKISFSLSVFSDKLVWYYVKDGRYSVKTGYYFVRKFLEGVNEGGFFLLSEDFCNKIWSLEVFLKVKSFLWRMCSGVFSMKGNV